MDKTKEKDIAPDSEESVDESGGQTSRREFLHLTTAGAVAALAGTSCSKERV